MELNGLLRPDLLNLVMHSRIPGLVSDAMKTFNDANSKTLETKDTPKKEKISALFSKEKRQKNLHFYAD